jgi:hypothetical protein
LQACTWMNNGLGSRAAVPVNRWLVRRTPNPGCVKMNRGPLCGRKSVRSPQTRINATAGFRRARGVVVGGSMSACVYKVNSRGEHNREEKERTKEQRQFFRRSCAALVFASFRPSRSLSRGIYAANPEYNVPPMRQVETRSRRPKTERRP